MMKRLFTAAITLALAVGLSASAGAQTYTLNSTTLSAAVASGDSTISVASTSAASGSSFGAIVAGQYVYVDQELMQVTAVSGTTLSVQRRNRPTAHASGATVYAGTGAAFQRVDPTIGSCTLASQGDPWINVENGKIWRCTNSYWANVIDEYVWLGPGNCQSSVSGNSTGTNGYTTLGTAPSIPVVQASTSTTGTNTHYYVCSLAPPAGRLAPARAAWIVDVQFYYGVQTTALGTQAAVLASGTMNGKTVFQTIAYPSPGASETAAGLAEATRADSGTLTIGPVVASFNTGTTTAGEFYSVVFTPASPITVATDRQQILLTVSLLNTATSATVTNSPGLLVHYRRVVGL